MKTIRLTDFEFSYVSKITKKGLRKTRTESRKN